MKCNDVPLHERRSYSVVPNFTGAADYVNLPRLGFPFAAADQKIVVLNERVNDTTPGVAPRTAFTRKDR